MPSFTERKNKVPQSRGMSAMLRRLAVRRIAHVMTAGALLAIGAHSASAQAVPGDTQYQYQNTAGLFSTGFTPTLLPAGDTSGQLNFGGTAAYTATDDYTAASINNLTFSDTGLVTIAPSVATNVLTLTPNAAGILASLNVGAGGATISTTLAGTTGFVKNGTGTLTLVTNADTWTGTALINSGTIAVNTGQSATASFNLANGATMTTNNVLAVGNIITALSGTSTFNESSATASNYSLAGNGNLSSSIASTATVNNNLLAGFGGTITFTNAASLRVVQSTTGGTFFAPFATVNFGALGGNFYSRNNAQVVLGGLASTSTTASLGLTSFAAIVGEIIGSANTNTLFAGQILTGGTTSLTKVGTGTLTLTGLSNYTAPTNLNGGTLKLDYSVNSSAILGNTVVTFGGGTLSLLGKSTGATTQTSGAVTVGQGGGTLIVNPNGGTSTTLTLGAITATAAGGTLNIQPPSAALGSGTATITTTTNKGADGTYGGRITFGSDWATTASAATPFTLSAYTGYTPFVGSGGVATTAYSLTDSGTLTASESFNSLKITDTTTGQTLNLGGNTLTLTNGGLLFAGANDYTIGGAAGSTLISNTATNSDLIIHQLGTGNLTIGAAIVNSAGNSTLTKAGSGTLTLTGANIYTGSTYLNGGTTSISSASGLGIPTAAATLVLNGGALQATGTFSLATGNNILNIGGGGGTFDVTGANNLTVTSVVTNLAVNQFGPVTKTGTGTLTLSGANTYGGSTIIRGGTLSTASLANGGTASGIGSSANVAPALILDGGTLQYTGAAQTTDRTFTLTQNGGALDSSGSGALGFTSLLPGAYSGTGNRTLTFKGTSTDNNTFAGPISDASATTGASGTVGVAKTGTGKWTLTGANTYTGNTTITGAGTLALSGASTNSIASSGTVAVGTGSTLDVTGLTGSAITLSSGQTLTGAGTVAGGVVTTAGSIVAPGSGGVGTLTVSTLTMAPGSIFNFEFNNTANDKITVATANGLTINGGGFNLFSEGTLSKFLTAGTYTLFNYTGTIGGTGIGALTSSSILNPQSGYSYAFSATGTNITLQITGSSSIISTWTPTGGGTWGSSANWSAGIPQSLGDTANFLGSITAPSTVTLDGSRAVADIEFSNTNSYTIAQGTAGTLFMDNGVATANINDLTGSHAISAPMTLNSNTVIGVTGSGDTLTLSGPVGGAGILSKVGLGTLALTNANSFASTTLSAGTLQVGNNNALGSGALTVSANSTLQAGGAGLGLANNIILGSGVTSTVDTQGNIFSLNGTISEGAASGSLTKTGSGTLILTGTDTYTGPTTISAGTLQMGNAGTTGSVAGNIVDNATLALNRTDDYTFGNVISGTGGLLKNGADNITVSGTNIFTGDTVIGAGSLILSNVSALQGSTLNYNNQGGTLSFGTLTAATLGGLKGAQNLALLNTTPAAVGLTVGGNNQSTTYSGILSGTGATLTKAGSGTLTLTGANTYDGATTSNGGLLLLGTGGVINGTAIFSTAGSIQVNGGALTSSATSNVTQGFAFTLTSGTATFNAGIKTSSTGGDGALIRIDGGTFTATNVTLQRTFFAAVPNATTFLPPAIPQNSGFVVMGGTVNLGSLFIGDNVSNSAADSYIGGGTTTVTNQIVLGQEQNNRYNYLQVAGGSITAADNTAAGGIVIGKSGSSIQSELYLTGGTATFGRIAYGTATDTSGGTANLVMNGGTLYVGSGGILNANTIGLATNTVLTAGTVGAAADWSSSLGMLLNGTTITIQAADAAAAAHNITLSGVLSGTGGLTKTGSGTLILSGANTYGGASIVNAGTLQASGTGTFGSTASNLTVNTGGTADLNDTNQAVNAVTSVPVTTGGTIVNNGSSAVTLTVGSGNSSGAYGGTIADHNNGGLGSVGLIKTGTGTETFVGANSYTGGTTVNGGTLSGNTASFGSAPITTASPGVVDYTQGGSGTANNNITGTGSVTVGGNPTGGNGAGGTVTYAAINNATGGTTVTGGRLELSHAGGGALSGPVAVAAGGVVGLASSNQIAGGSSVALLASGTLSAEGNSEGVGTKGGTVTPTGALGTLQVGSPTLAATSTIDFGDVGGTHNNVLAFADSSSLTWNGTVNVINYTGTGDQLYVGTTGGGLTLAQLSQISFNGVFNATQLGNGEVVMAAAPEPSGWASMLVGLGVLGAVIARKRRKAAMAA